MNSTAYLELLSRFSTLADPVEALEGDGPQVLFPIGISGSGKSSALSAAAKKGWTLINSDEVRRQNLRRLFESQISLEINGQRKIPDPNRPEDVFAPEIRRCVPEWILGDFQAALSARQSIVLDVTNLTLERVRYLGLARAHSHRCVALLFPSLDLSINASRVKGRGLRGGLDLVDAQAPDADERRRKILEQLNRNFWCFLETIGEGSSADRPLAESEIRRIDFQRMKDHAGTFASYLSTLDSDQRLAVEKLALLDRFDRVYVLKAPSKTVPK
jgi:hypothetical protein